MESRSGWKRVRFGQECGATEIGLSEYIQSVRKSDYQNILNMKVADLHCKHVMKLDGCFKASIVERESAKIGYQWVVWGSHQHNSDLRDWKRNREYQRAYINKMIGDGLDNALRIVLLSGGSIWADNLHTAIRNMWVYGDTVKLKDIKCYIVDLSMAIDYSPIIFSQDGVVDWQRAQGILDVSYKRQSRVNSKIERLYYSIGEFIDDNSFQA